MSPVSSALGPVTLLTISREFGAGGHDLAEGVAAALGWPVLDRQLAAQVAERLRVQPDLVDAWDEHPPSLMERIASVLLVPHPEVPATIVTDEFPTPDTIASAALDVMREAVSGGPIIIVGHGAQFVFRERTDALHVRVVGDVADRVTRVAERLQLTRERAEAMTRQMDADRVAYLKRHFHADVHDPLAYDCVLNTSRITIADAIAIVTTAIRLRGAHTE